MKKLSSALLLSTTVLCVHANVDKDIVVSSIYDAGTPIGNSVVPTASDNEHYSYVYGALSSFKRQRPEPRLMGKYNASSAMGASYFDEGLATYFAESMDITSLYPISRWSNHHYNLSVQKNIKDIVNVKVGGENIISSGNDAKLPAAYYVAITKPFEIYDGVQLSFSVGRGTGRLDHFYSSLELNTEHFYAFVDLMNAHTSEGIFYKIQGFNVGAALVNTKHTVATIAYQLKF